MVMEMHRGRYMIDPDELRPFVLMFREGTPIGMAQIEMGDHDEKIAMVEAVKQVIHQTGADATVLSTEAWMTMLPRDRDIEELRSAIRSGDGMPGIIQPRLDPNRVETLICEARAADGTHIVRITKILRGEDGSFTGFEPFSEGDAGAADSIFDFFGRPQNVTVN
jgi:hypothetical protein